VFADANRESAGVWAGVDRTTTNTTMERSTTR